MATDNPSNRKNAISETTVLSFGSE